MELTALALFLASTPQLLDKLPAFEMLHDSDASAAQTQPAKQ